MSSSVPSMDQWIKEAKEDASAPYCGMYLFHNGTVRLTPKAKVRQTKELEQAGQEVSGMEFSSDPAGVEAAREAALKLPGVYYARVWLNSGVLKTGDDIMLVLVGGDIRPHVIDGLQFLVGRIKSECVSEKEIYQK